MNKIHDSLKINESGKWYWHSRHVGGTSPIELVQQLEGLGHVEAVKRLCDKPYEWTVTDTPRTASTSSEKSRQPFTLSERNKKYSRAIAYLCQHRGIDSQVVFKLIKQKKLYESADHHNVVFVGYDQEKVGRYATVRGTVSEAEPFRHDIEGSDKSCPFSLEGKSSTVFVFESPIDAMSHATIYKNIGRDWQADHRISLGGFNQAALDYYLRQHTDITKIMFCLDNDYDAKFEDGRPAPNWGQEHAKEFSEHYTALGYQCLIDTPRGKDFNVDLCNMKYYLQQQEQSSENKQESGYELEISRNYD